MTSNTLLKQLVDFQFQTGSPQLSFADRLARDNGWSGSFARRVIKEYLRFVYLCASGTAMHTPSDAVDQAWHLHLVYTRSYWDDLCGDILKAPLHHQPTRGGVSQGAQWAEAYQHTLDRYRKAFGETPPADIWPAVADRFKDAARFRRVNTGRFWLLPKRAATGALSAAGLGLAALPAYAAGGGVGISLLVVLAVGAALALGITAYRKRQKSNDGGGAGCGGAGGADGSSSKSGSEGAGKGADGGADGSSGCGGGCGGCGG